MLRRSLPLASLAALGVFASMFVCDAASAAGWKFWEKESSESSSSGIGGTPYASRGKPAPSSPPFSMTRMAKGAWSTTTTVSKKAAQTTVDLVTLKPLRTTKKAPSQFRLGSHPDQRAMKPKTSLFGSLFAPKSEASEPRTANEFFAQERPR